MARQADTESQQSAEPEHKKARRTRLRRSKEALQHATNGAQPNPQPQHPPVPEVSLFVRWQSSGGSMQVTRLPLRRVNSVDDLEGMSRTLVKCAFPAEGRPDYLVTDEFYKFTPADEFMTLPGDLHRTFFRLVLHMNGWEYCILERELGAHHDPTRTLTVTVIEFESSAMMMGQLDLRVCLMTYPMVSIKKTFLDDMHNQIQSDPGFTGIL